MRNAGAMLCRLILIAACFFAGLAVLTLCLVMPPLTWGLAGLVAWKNLHKVPWLFSGGTASIASLMRMLRYGLLCDSGLILGTAEDAPLPSRFQAVRVLLSPGVGSRYACQIFLAAFFGRWCLAGTMIRLHGFTHLATFAPTGRGKGVSVLIPNLLSHVISCVVTDPKCELFQITSEHRRKRFRHRIIRLDPYRLGGPDGDTLNPLDFINDKHEDFLDQCRDLAAALVMRSGQEKEPYWNDAAELVICGVIAFICACETDPAERNLQCLRDIVASRVRFARTIEVMQQVTTHDGVISRLGHLLTWFVDRELASVMTSVQRHTQFLDSPAIARHTAKSSFDPKGLRSRMTVYLCLPHDRLTTMAPLQRMWVSTILRTITQGVPSERNPVLFLLDEAAHLGKIQILEDAVTVMRGMGIRLWFFFQSLNQIKECYGDKAGTFLDNIDTQQYFGTNHYDTAEAVAKRIGFGTILVDSRNWGKSTSMPVGGMGHQAGSWSSNTGNTLSEMSRMVFRPEEIINLPEDTALVFHKNMPVIVSRLLRYYDSPAFANGGVGKPPGLGFGLGLAAVACLLASMISVSLAGKLGVAIHQQRAQMSDEAGDGFTSPLPYGGGSYARPIQPWRAPRQTYPIYRRGYRSY
jgi:type IV secretion system protein VirD4